MKMKYIQITKNKNGAEYSDFEVFCINHCNDIETVLKELNNSISKDKIRAKIEEYEKLLQSCNKFSAVKRIMSINERILAYKELLEEE